jgi:hypothetical protein
MKLWIKYGLFNSIIGLLIGTFVSINAIGNGYYVFIIAAPISAFVVGGFLWKFLIDEKNQSQTVKKIITGILTGTLSHYFTFILLSIIMNVCYWTTGNCLSSLGEKPASILDMLTGAFAFSFFSLLFFGWITVPASIMIGFLIKKKIKTFNIMFKKLPVHWLFKGFFPHRVHYILIGNRSANGNFSYMYRLRVIYEKTH